MEDHVMNIRSITLPLLVALATAPLAAGCTGDAIDDLDDVDVEENVDSQSSAQTVARPIGEVRLPDLALEPVDPIDPTAPRVTETASGDGWRTLHVTGSVPDADTGEMRTVDDDIIIVERQEALDSAPLGQKTRLQLKQKVALQSATVGTAAAAPTDGDALITVIHKKTMDQVEATDPAQAGMMYFGCGDYDNDYTKSLVNIDRSFSHTKGHESGKFTGSFAASGRFQGNVTAKITYRVNKTWCVPSSVSFKRAELTGNGTLTAKGDVDGQFHQKWNYDKQVIKPKLLDQWFMVGPVPVYLRVFLPVDVGLDAEAKATLKASANVVGKANFNIACTKSGCSGTRSATLSWAENQPPTFDAQARVKVTPWAQASARAVLYGETVGAYAQVGVRAGVPIDLWAYAGNGCGDADNDGKNEFVNALTVDMRAQGDIVGQVVAAGKQVWGRSWNVADRHLLFKKLGSSTALDPIFYREAGGAWNQVKMRGQMRPCWPYKDAIKYRVTWSDGAVTQFTGAPGALFAKEHTFAAAGVKPIKLEALEDTAGRKIAGTRTQSVTVRPWLFEPVAPVKEAVLLR
jgi:hypothetical protein